MEPKLHNYTTYKKKIKSYNDYVLEKYTADWAKHNDSTYYFKIEDNEYFVKFGDTSGSISVTFGITTQDDYQDEKWSFEDLNKSNAFKTMSTVSEIVKDFIANNSGVKKITFFGVHNAKDKSNIPNWLLRMLSSTPFTYYLADYINSAMVRPVQWLSKPSQRTKMFGRWAERETKDMNWKVNRIGNEIQLIKENFPPVKRNLII
jgi:hypothetical protein